MSLSQYHVCEAVLRSWQAQLRCGYRALLGISTFPKLLVHHTTRPKKKSVPLGAGGGWV